MRAACAEASRRRECVEAVNFNAPAQVVIAGYKAAVEKRLRSREGEGRQARVAAAGVGAVPFVAAQAGVGSPARLSGRT